MHPELVALKQSIAIRTEHIARSPTVLRVKQHDAQMSGSNFTISNEVPNASVGSPQAHSDPQTLFTVDGKLMSWTQRHAFRDSSGLPLFDLYRNPSGSSWHVDLPGKGGLFQAPLVRLSPRWDNLTDRVIVNVRNAACDGEDVELHALGQDVWKLRTNVYLGDKVVMTAKRTEKLTPYCLWKRPEWIVEVSEGMDTSLASVIMVVLAATMYNTSIPASVVHANESKQKSLVGCESMKKA